MSALIGNDLSMEAYRKTLLKPYLFHIQSNSSAILKQWQIIYRNSKSN